MCTWPRALTGSCTESTFPSTEVMEVKEVMEQKNDFKEPPGESIHPGGSISQRVQMDTSLFKENGGFHGV